MRNIPSRALEARVLWKNRVTKTRVLIADMEKFSSHGTRVLKTQVLEK